MQTTKYKSMNSKTTNSLMFDISFCEWVSIIGLERYTGIYYLDSSSSDWRWGRLHYCSLPCGALWVSLFTAVTEADTSSLDKNNNNTNVCIYLYAQHVIGLTHICSDYIMLSKVYLQWNSGTFTIGTPV